MTRATTAQELAAAARVAAELGVGPITPIVASLSKHTIIHLAPLPFVARLRSTVDIGRAHDDLAREVDVAGYLAVRNAPVIRPARTIDPGPHVRDGCAMTLWDFTPHRAAAGDSDEWLVARSLQHFHAAFAPFGDALPLFTDPIDACGILLADGSRLPALDEEDRHFLGMLHVRLRAALRGYTYRSMPLHGDAHLGNALLTDAGAVWGDLEAVCSGPREWDIACLPESTWPAFDGCDLALARCCADLRSLCVAVWCRADHGRSPQVDEAATYHLAFRGSGSVTADPISGRRRLSWPVATRKADRRYWERQA